MAKDFTAFKGGGGVSFSAKGDKAMEKRQKETLEHQKKTVAKNKERADSTAKTYGGPHGEYTGGKRQGTSDGYMARGHKPPEAKGAKELRKHLEK